MKVPAKKRIAFLMYIFPAITCIAQDTLTVRHLNDSVRQTDIVELLFGRKSNEKSPEEIKNKKVDFSVLPAVGYTPATGLVGLIASNMEFNLGDPQTTYASVVSTSAAYSVNKQFVLPLRFNIWSKNNTWNFIGDWRFMKYPQNTYGLGGSSKEADANLIDYNYIRFYQSVLHHVYSKLYVGGGVRYDHFFNIQENWSGTDSSQFASYGVGTGSSALTNGFNVQCIWDNRKNTINPEKGSYLNIELRVSPPGMGDGSVPLWGSVYADFRKYINLPTTRDNILGFWLLYWGAPIGTAPYLLLPSNGWDTYTNTGRGYVQGRFRSTNMIYSEAEYRYRITNNGLLGGVFFVNAATYSEPNTNQFKYVYPAVGTGLRLKLNRKSNTNIMIDFAVGLHGSNGFYLDIGEAF